MKIHLMHIPKLCIKPSHSVYVLWINNNVCMQLSIHIFGIAKINLNAKKTDKQYMTANTIYA